MDQEWKVIICFDNRIRETKKSILFECSPYSACKKYRYWYPKRLVKTMNKVNNLIVLSYYDNMNLEVIDLQGELVLKISGEDLANEIAYKTTDVSRSKKRKPIANEKQTDVILPIAPKYVEKIFNGKKKYEYRKVLFSRDVKKVYIYETFPTSKIVGLFEIDDIFIDTPDEIWEITKREGGVEKSFFESYYEKRAVAVAYKIKNVEKYDTPKELELFNLKHAPQSYVYVNIDKND